MDKQNHRKTSATDFGDLFGVPLRQQQGTGWLSDNRRLCYRNLLVTRSPHGSQESLSQTPTAA
ncbi:MAG: hypothetical protein P8J37_09815 [Fuerstiella sp.]|nr:hypothetical protein [Fuerstiella sp.]